jgi:hypothetical protein
MTKRLPRNGETGDPRINNPAPHGDREPRPGARPVTTRRARRPFAHGRADPVEVGRIGGKASAESRRARVLGEVGAVLERLAAESFHDFFARRLGHEDASWATWRLVARLYDGTAYDVLSPAEQDLYRRLSGGRTTVPRRLTELWIIAGRGSGKSRFAAAAVAYAASRRYDLRRGERVHAFLLAADQEQAGILFGTASDFLTGDADLKHLVTRQRNDRLDLAHGVTVQVRAGSWRKVRGPTYALVAGDEVSYWWSDDTASNPDAFVLRSVRPGLLKLRGGPGRLLCVTTPHMQQGATWAAYDQHFGKEHERVLVLHGDTRTFNPKMSAEAIAAEVADDPLATAEYDATWRTDLAAFLSPEAIAAVTEPGVLERPPEPGVSYVAFADMSGGSKDSLALCIAHLDADGETAVVDLVRERPPPLDIEGTISEWGPMLERYGIAAVTGDRYARQLTWEVWARGGIAYEFSALSASEIFLEALPVINTRRCVLPDDQTLRLQLTRLVRQARRGGKDLVTHPAGGHDDVAVVACGAIVTALGLQAGGREKLFPPEWFEDDDGNAEAAA